MKLNYLNHTINQRILRIHHYTNNSALILDSNTFFLQILFNSRKSCNFAAMFDIQKLRLSVYGNYSDTS